MLVGQQAGHPACKKMGGWWRWALVSLDGVAPSQMVCVSTSVNLPLHHKVQKFASGTGSPGWKKGHKTVVVVVVELVDMLCYMGDMLCVDGDADADVEARVHKRWN